MIIPEILKKGKRIVTPSFHCLVRKSTTPDFAIIVNKKIQKSAVKRNRIKRIIRASMTKLLPTLPFPMHCLVVVKKDCSMKKTNDMTQELNVLKTL
jgi:ribonuclease P protein component